MLKQAKLAVLALAVLSLGFLQGCTSGNFYLKTVAAKDAKITNNIKIAVIPENWYWLGVSNFLPRALVTEFMDMGFTVVERAQLEQVIRELKLEASGVVKEGEADKKMPGVDFTVLDRTSIKKLGEVLGVDALLVSYIVPSYSENLVNQATFRLVDVETAQVLFSVTFINSSTDGTRSIKGGGAVPTQKVIRAISLSIEKLLKGEKKVEAKMGPMDIVVNTREK